MCKVQDNGINSWKIIWSEKESADGSDDPIASVRISDDETLLAICYDGCCMALEVKKWHQLAVWLHYESNAARMHECAEDVRKKLPPIGLNAFKQCATATEETP